MTAALHAASIARRGGAAPDRAGGAEHAAAAVVATASGVVAEHGDDEHGFRWASVTKLLDRLRDARRGRGGRRSTSTSRPGPEGSTVRHLLAHASGLAVRARHADRRAGRAADLLEPGLRACSPRTSRPAPRCRSRSTSTRRCSSRSDCGASCDGDAGAAASRHARRRARASARELLAPTLVAPETLAEATSVQFPGPRRRAARLRPLRTRTTGASASSSRTRRRRTGRAR